MQRPMLVFTLNDTVDSFVDEQLVAEEVIKKTLAQEIYSLHIEYFTNELKKKIIQ